MKPTNPAAFEPVLAWLDAGAPHIQVPGDGELDGFYMGDWMGNVDTERQRHIASYYGTAPVCGTVCCIAGALCLWHDKRCGDSRRAAEIAGMEAPRGELDTDAENLFTPTRFLYDGRPVYPLRTSDPHWAARVIRKYIDTGAVDWEGCYIPPPPPDTTRRLTREDVDTTSPDFSNVVSGSSTDSPATTGGGT